MPKKKINAVAKADRATDGTAEYDVPVRFGDEVVRVEARYHVPAVHPSARGPWADEADKTAWTDEETGYPMIIRRSPETGALHGYVAVEREHPLYGFDAEELEIVLSAHGPIDYAAACQVSGPHSRSICHSTSAHSASETRHMASLAAGGGLGRDDAWWIGFGCDGPTDLVPRVKDLRQPDVTNGLEERVYRDETYVRRYCLALGRQLKAVEEGRDPTPYRLTRVPIGTDPRTAEG